MTYAQFNKTEDDKMPIIPRCESNEQRFARIARQNPEEAAIDECVDELDSSAMAELLSDNIGGFDNLLTACAQEWVKPDDYDRLGRHLGQLVRDHAIKKMEKV